MSWRWLLIFLAGCAIRMPRADLEDGCRQGLPRRCTQLANQLFLEQDERAAVPWLARACQLGDLRSCLFRGAMSEWGVGVAEDRAQARGIYAASCKAGSREACEWVERIDELDAITECKPAEVVGVPEFARAIKLQKEPLRFCYSLVLEEDAELEIDATIEWKIGTDGRVHSATVTKNSRPDLGVAACARERILRWRFPCPSGETRGVIPIQFRPGAE